MIYYGIIRLKTTQLESRDIHPTHMTSSVIPSLMSDGHCDVDTQYAEMLMSASRTQKVNKAFHQLLMHTLPSIARLKSHIVLTP
jgi:hypothetical protein